MRRGSNLPQLADYNQAVVLDLIRRDPGQSRTDLQRNSRLSSQTISNITRRLIDAELVRESTPGDPGRGRPSIPLAVNGGGAFAVGVHVDPARLTILLLDIAGSVRHRRQLPTPQATNPGEVTALIARTVADLVAEAAIDPTRVLGVGIAAPGPLDVQNGVVLDPPQLPKWKHVQLRADLHATTDLPVLLDKDVTASATAELRSSSFPDFLFLYLGSGVGASVVLDGEVLRGASNNIGEIGDILVDPDAEDLGWSGRRGGLAAACVPEALVIQASRAGLMPLPDLTDYVAVDDACAALTRLAHDGHQEAVDILDLAARRVAVGIGVLVNLLDVPHVVVGGPIWDRLAPSFSPVLAGAVPREFVVSRPDFTVTGSTGGHEIAAKGAAELVLDQFLAPRASNLVMG